jgi:chemotaxis protein MotB
MMAGLLMLFVLIMCVTLFQAQKNYVDKLAEQEEKLTLQNEYTSALLEKQSELDEQENQLKTQDELLAEQEKRLAEQNLTLEELQEALAEQAALLDEKTATLAQQQTTLEEQQATLSQQQTTLEQQEEELNAKTEELKEKQTQIDKIIGVKAEVIEALSEEFQKNDMSVAIDTETGALVLDSNVLFDYDDVELSDAGCEMLSQALPIYCKVLLDEKYLDNVAEIIIDGYTDTDGSYEYNLELSQRRSLAVAQYLLELKDSFLDDGQVETLQEKLTVNGHSMSNPILDENGNVDKDASRRVEVKFRLRDEEMLEELYEMMN